MSGWLIALTGGIYAVIAFHQLWKQNIPMFVVYAGYAFSNIGLFYLERMTSK